MNGVIPPPLPPRRSPSPHKMSQTQVEEANLPFTSPASTLRTDLPPPLPPRNTNAAHPVSPPITVPSAADLDFESRIVTEHTPRVDVTPATPPQSGSPVDGVPPSFGQNSETIRGSPLPPDQAESIKNDHFESTSSPSAPSSPPPTTPTAPPTSPVPAPQLPPRSRTNQTTASTPVSPDNHEVAQISLPKLEWLVLGALVLNLVLIPYSFSWVAIAAGAYVAVKWLQLFEEKRHHRTHAETTNPNTRLDPGGVAWVNHALYALFPLISTDLLTPFVDLVEDALMQQVPPVVTSVRITSPSLGSQPLIIKSLRAMSDEEWFAALAPPGQPKTPQVGAQANAKGSTSSPAGWVKGHMKKSSTASRLSRTVSASSSRSAVDPEDVNRETQKRRKRDRILQSISRRNKRAGAGAESDVPDQWSHIEDHDRSGVERPNGQVDKEGDEDDPDIGEYVNYQVEFEYFRPKATKKAAWGIHALAYFGWGIKGVGKSEIPVYIDVLSVRGSMCVRLLLSATPPFVRTATVSLPKLPEFDISATPLKRGTFNAMELPGMKSYVQASILDVASAFVRPESFTLDVDRLLLGREASLRTHTVGVLHVIIHGADDLPKTDTVGSCDPYVAISFTKFHKPVFSTRTIIDTQSPSWEEEAFILVTADAIESGERLRLRLCDSDRFSADDAMGVVEVDLADLVDQTSDPEPDAPLERRNDVLKADRPGMRVSGSLDWSVRFCPLWQMAEHSIADNIKDKQVERVGEPDQNDMVLPWWVEWVNRYMDVPDWELERRKRRKETLAWFTGDREREEMEAATKPTDELRSGILQFHIHQCSDLEIESLEGTYSSNGNHRLSGASGKPALADIIDRTPTENPDPPSAYCEVYLNDRLVYRTRTKQVTPLPYFNAVSERFIRDWTKARIVFVVRDERNREHDPLLGLISIRLRDALADRSHFTRWFPLVGGLGWGRIRLSLLFKPVEIRLPRDVSGYEVATLEISSLSATDTSKQTDRSVSVVLQTEADRFTIETPGEQDGLASPNKSRASLDLYAGPGTPMTMKSFDFEDANEIEWEIDRPIRLAVQYRHSCSVVISFVTKSKVVKKKRILGLAIVRLNDCPDGEECERTVPIFATSEVKDAIKGSDSFAQSRQRQNEDGPATPSSAASGNRSPRILGFVNLSMVLHPGVSRVHRKLCKKDMRFAKVYETWECVREVDLGWDQTSAGDMLRSTKNKVMRGDQGAEDEEEDIDDESDTTEDEEYENDAEGVRRNKSMSNGKARSPGKERGDLELEDDDGIFSERRAHSHALHKRHKGIFQLKIARTGRFVKDKIEAKLHSGNRERRRGADLDVEHEGQSSL